MKKFILIISILMFCQSFLNSQTLSEEQVKKIKSATVYIQVKHDWLPTDDEYTPSGSGFFISPYGHLVTNYHVIQSSLQGDYSGYYYPAPIKEITIVCKSGSKELKKYKAYILAANMKDDLAVLQIEDTVKTPYIELDSTSKLMETSPTLIFGFPFGEKFAVLQYGPEISVTKGIISAIRHDEKGVFTKLQLDAEANPGNSGGPAISEDGKVVAVVSSILRDTKLSFGVPTHYLSNLLKHVDLTKRSTLADSVKSSFTSDPPGADVFIDFKKVGTTPLYGVNVRIGFHNVYMIKKDFYVCIQNNAFLKPDTMEYKFSPVRPSTFASVKADKNKSDNYSSSKKSKNSTDEITEATSKSYQQPPKEVKTFFNDLYTRKVSEADVLKSEGFDAPDSIANWKENSGGDYDRDAEWYIEDSHLNQFLEDDYLHAITLGDSAWTNYAVTAKVKIPRTSGVAGIVFRSTWEGFYIFYLSRDAQKVKLIYHMNNPYGWVTVYEKKLDFEVKDQWYNLSAILKDNKVFCFLDTNCVISARTNISTLGKVGFYSVSAKCEFDSLYVTKLPESLKKVQSRDTNEITDVSISDYFDYKSIWWYPYRNDKAHPEPWYMMDEGCAQLDDNADFKYMEMTNYKFGKYDFKLDLTTIKGDDKSKFVVYYRKSNDEYYRVELSKKDNKMRLYYIKDNVSKLLTEKKLSSYFFDRKSSIYLRIYDNKIKFSYEYYQNMHCKVKGIGKTPGYFGFGTSGLKVIIHKFNITDL
jgi:hypothetical protein